MHVVDVRENDWTSLVGVLGAGLDAEMERALRGRVRRLGERIRRDLGLRSSPLELEVVQGEPRLRATGIAGTLELSRRVVVQVRPKFAKEDDADRWQQSVLTILDRVRGSRVTYGRSPRLSVRPVTFIDHMALAYADALDDALRNDPIRTYRTFEERAPFLRGQLAIERQVTALLTRPDRIECNVDYLQTDNPYNVLLHWAASRFAVTTTDSRVRHRVRVAASGLPPLPVPPRGPGHVPLLPPPQYRHFAAALEIASTLARGQGHTQDAGRTSGYGYLLGMERIFERFIERSLAHVVPQLGLRVAAQVTERYATALTPGQRSYYTKPDNVVYDGDVPCLLVDAKYKRFEDADEGTPKRPNNADLYQMTASLIAHGARRGLLIAPRLGGEAPYGAGGLRLWSVPFAAGSNGCVGAAAVDLGGLTGPAELATFDAALVALLEELDVRDQL